MRINPRAVAALLASLVGAQAAAAASQDKIAPWVLEKTAGGQTAEFLVVLSRQADLAGARGLATKQAKGRFVRDALFELAQATQGPLLAELQARGVEHRAYYVVNAIWVRGDRALATALAARPDVLRIEGNPVIRNVLPPSREGAREAPEVVEQGINYVRAPQVWALGFTGQGIVVGGQDTGYRWSHNALRPQYRGWNGSTASHDFNWHDSVHSGGGICGANSPVPCDDFFHGSHTMGTAVGHDTENGGVNQVGMAPGAKWIGCRDMDQGNGTPATYLECFEFFLAPYPVGGTPGQGDPALAPHVTVNSWTCPPAEGCTTPGILLAAVQAQRAAGIVTEVSAGNSGPGCSTIDSPAPIYDESFSVGALNNGADSLAGFSSRGPVTVDGSNRVKPDIAAPGTNVRSASNGSDTQYTFSDGTSMAGPHVAGAVALLLSAVPALSGDVDAIEERLANTAFRISSGACSSTPGVFPNNLFGYGRLDVLCAVHDNLSAVSISVVGSTDVCPTCTGGTATAADTGGGPATHQWGFRTSPGGAMTSFPGQTAATYLINGADFPGPGSYLLVERTTSTSGCGAPLVSNEVPVNVTLVTASTGDATVSEGNAGGTTASFSVTLSGASAGAVSVDYATADGTATVADGDYAAASGTLTFAAGQTTQPLDVTVNGDTGFEASETFLVNLTNPQGAMLGDGQGLGTIVNDDASTAAGSRVELVHGSSLRRSLGAVGSVAYDDYFRIREGARSSWEIVVDAATGDIGSSGPALERIAADGSTVLQSSVAAGAGSSRSLSFENASSAPLDEYVRVRSTGCGAGCGPEDVYLIRAYETTLLVPRFNNSGTQITVLVVQNVSDRAIAGTLWFREANGALAGSTTLSLAPRSTQILNTATVVSGMSGTIAISHDGRYGDLTGKAVAVEPATGFTFDTALQPRPR